MAFVPKPKRALTPLEEKWERKLKRERMPAEIRPLTASSDRDGLKVQPTASKFQYDAGDDRHQTAEWAEADSLETYGRLNPDPASFLSFAEQAVADAFPAPVTAFDLPQARFWALFSQALHQLPDDYAKRDRQFLFALADSGNVNEVRLTFKGMSDPTAYRILKRFAAWRKANGC